MIVYSDWQVRNSQRKYPIDEACSAAGDDGSILPESFLVDAAIWVPKYEYSYGETLKYVYLSSAQVSGSLVSITILGCTEHLDTAEPIFVPLGSISLVKPVEPYKNYPIEPLLDGVTGWVAFGQAVNGEPISLSFSRPNQAMFVPKAARFYDYLPIPNMSVYGGTSTVTGDVTVLAQPPFVAEIKDMRLYGEVADRQMLVISLEQTEETLSTFAGPCGKRPETGNCVNTPITSIAGVAPDCTGNLNIQFDPEIIVRYFTNPFYPVDPIPIRGGMCLDAAFSIDDMCNKTRTLPDDQGLLPSAYTYQRPCDLVVPFTVSFSDPSAFKTVQMSSGYVYMDGYDAYITAGLGAGAELSPCVDTLKLSEYNPTKREHTVSFTSVPPGASVGMFALDTVNTRIFARIERGPDEDTPGTYTVSKYNKGLKTDEYVYASGPWPGNEGLSAMSISVDSNRVVTVNMGSGSTTFTLGETDEYYTPSGKTGVYVGGATDGFDFNARPAVGISGYGVADVPA